MKLILSRNQFGMSESQFLFMLALLNSVSIHSLYIIIQMDVKKVGKNITKVLEKNIKPLSNNLLPFKHGLLRKQQVKTNDDEAFGQVLKIQQQYQLIKANADFDSKINMKIISCLKLAEYTWREYQGITNKNGQTAATYHTKFDKINKKMKEILQQVVVHGSLEQIKKASDFLAPAMNALQQKSRKFYQHQNQFKIISKRVEQNKQEQFEQEEEIKDEILGLVQKFKNYAVNIQEVLTTDKDSIELINKSQDQQLSSLTNKSETMNDIISQQKLGVIELLIMGVIATVLWIAGLFFVLVF